MQRLSAPENPKTKARRIATEARTNAGKPATTLQGLKTEVAKLAEAVELLLDRIE